MEVRPEVACEFGVPVRDDGCWHPMVAKNCVEKKGGDVGGSVLGMAGGKVNLFGESVNKDSDHVETTSCVGKMSCKIH